MSEVYLPSCEVKENSSCFTYTDVQANTDAVVNFAQFQYREGHSLILMDAEFESECYQYHDNGTGYFYLERSDTYLKLVLVFLTRLTLTTVSQQYNNIIEATQGIPMLGVCNTSCGLTWEATGGNCRTYNELAALVRGRRPVCHNENISVNVSVKSGIVMINLHNDFDSLQLSIVENVEFIDCRGKSPIKSLNY